jgi:two-component system, NtrC family, sensor histidine kinase PilS
MPSWFAATSAAPICRSIWRSVIRRVSGAVPNIGMNDRLQVVVDDRLTWRPLRFFNLYRLILSGLFSLLAVSDHPIPPLGVAEPETFTTLAIGYLGFALVTTWLVSLHRPPFTQQLYLQVMGDILFLALMMSASGGATSGVGVLMIFVVATGAMLASGREALFFAAIAAIAILAEEIHDAIYGQQRFAFVFAGLLGITLFATAALAHLLSRYARESEALALQRGVDLANMAQLSRAVIEQMAIGVVAVDRQNQIHLMNQAACHLLAMPLPESKSDLTRVTPQLEQRLSRWRKGQLNQSETYREAASGLTLQAQLVPLDADRQGATLILLSDITRINEEAQQLKLAALGRLTASIAHEIRNPLAAIDHASALLAESPLNPGDQHLLAIVRQQTYRINQLVESILQLGRRDRPIVQSLEPEAWLTSLIEEITLSEAVPNGAIALEFSSAIATMTFDPERLRRILTNLIQNGLRHASAAPLPRVRLIAMREATEIVIDIIDAGPGIKAEELPHIFEPFYTTRHGGTGLGLYIARELAESLGAQLTWQPTPEGLSCFRLALPVSL